MNSTFLQSMFQVTKKAFMTSFKKKSLGNYTKYHMSKEKSKQKRKIARASRQKNRR